MRKKTSKLLLAFGMLAAVAMVGASPKSAQAVQLCPPYCLDPACHCVIHCYWLGGGCICDRFCSIGPGDGGPD